MVQNYHVAPLGTFHSKFAVIDREIALVNSNNINIRSNVEMMCQFEGDIVNSLYDAFLISWGRVLANPPGLPCLNVPTPAFRKFTFGKRNAYVNQHPSQQGRSHEGEHDSTEPTHLPEGHDHVDPTRQIEHDSEMYDKQNHLDTAMPINERLNLMKSAEETFTDHESDFVPFYLHSPHDPVPMAAVNRPPQNIPGHHDLHNPQNAVWLGGTPNNRDHLTCSPQTRQSRSLHSISCIQRCPRRRSRSQRM